MENDLRELGVWGREEGGRWTGKLSLCIGLQALTLRVTVKVSLLLFRRATPRAVEQLTFTLDLFTMTIKTAPIPQHLAT